MSLRTRLIVAFFALSVVPLAAVTLYAYTSNARAFRLAAEREADLLAGELGQRMQLVTAQLSERVEHLMDMTELQRAAERAVAKAAAPKPEPAVVDTAAMGDTVTKALGEAAMLLNNVELHGLMRAEPRTRPAPSARGSGRQGPGRRGVPPDLSTSTQDRVPRSPLPAPTPPPPPVAGALPPPPPPPDEMKDRIKIDIAPIRRAMFKQIVPEGKLENLTAEERVRVAREVNQRMLGIVDGIRMGATELQRKADATARASQNAARTRTTESTSAPAMKKSTSLSGSRLDVKLEQNGKIVQQANAEINLANVLATVFSTTRRDRGEVPFAVGKDGQLYTPKDEDRARIMALGAIARPNGPLTLRTNQWVVVTTEDPSGSGMRLGIARPVGDSLNSLRRTAARNAGLGMLFIALALAGIVPLSMRLTRNLSTLSDGVRRIAAGDYRARVPVRARDEIGQLAQAFNQMAEDVERHQRAAVGQERIKRELELGRQIQSDMLPHAPLRLGLMEVKGVSVPAREVGGDFFNYFELGNGDVALLVGDVSGKGVGAALLMANIQASLRTRLALGQGLSAVAEELDVDIQANTPGPVYATLFVGILNPATRRLRYVNAGHNPQYVLRNHGGLERMKSTGLPIGLLAGHGFVEQQLELEAGDLLFFYTDGCVEAENEQGDMFGSDQLEELLIAGGASGIDDVLTRVEMAATRFRGSREPFDDATMMAVKIG